MNSICTHTSCGHLTKMISKEEGGSSNGSHETKHSMPPKLCLWLQSLRHMCPTTTFTYHCLFLGGVRGDTKLINFIMTPQFIFFFLGGGLGVGGGTG